VLQTFGAPGLYPWTGSQIVSLQRYEMMMSGGVSWQTPSTHARLTQWSLTHSGPQALQVAGSTQAPPQQAKPAAQSSDDAQVRGGACVVVVVGAAVVGVVVVGATTVPVQFPGGMQRELPLP
jgi:hypothetical protein